MQGTYLSYKIHIISEIVDVADALSYGWVFRGQADSTWPISSSLEREIPENNNDERENFEARCLKEIRSTSTKQQADIPANTDDFSCLALLQHHGCKTRLVDFTESFYVALYFAAREFPDEDAVVWAIATPALDTRITLLCDKHNFELSEEEMPRRLVNNSIELPDRYSDNEELAIVYSKPTKQGQRMISQQGLFLAPLNLDIPFMENLEKCLRLTGTPETAKDVPTLDKLKEAAEHNTSVIRFEVSAQDKNGLLFHFKRMNITEATLFPGLDGFARSLNYYAIGIED